MNENMGSAQQDFLPGRSQDFMDGKAILAKKIKDDQRQRQQEVCSGWEKG